MRIKPVVATGTIRIARTKAITLDNGRLHVPAMCSLWTTSHTMHNSTYNWGADAQQYKPVRMHRRSRRPHSAVLSLFRGSISLSALLFSEKSTRALQMLCATAV